MANDRQLLTDIHLELLHHELRAVYATHDTKRTEPAAQGRRVVEDLATVSGAENLGQAIVMRLLTPRGELAALAHPDYGSRLHELVGERNTKTKRNLVRLFILEALRQEPRIEKVLAVNVDPNPVQRDRVDVFLSVKPIGPTAVIDIGPITLEL